MSFDFNVFANVYPMKYFPVCYETHNVDMTHFVSKEGCLVDHRNNLRKPLAGQLRQNDFDLHATFYWILVGYWVYTEF